MSSQHLAFIPAQPAKNDDSSKETSVSQMNLLTALHWSSERNYDKKCSQQGDFSSTPAWFASCIADCTEYTLRYEF